VNLFFRVLIIPALAGGFAVFTGAQTQSFSSAPNGPAQLTCSPTPCVLPPTQVSQGPNESWDAAIAADPSNPQNIVVGTSDGNCGEDGGATPGFLVSGDGGSDWSQYCMPGRGKADQFYYTAVGPPILGGYDRNGVAYIGSYYSNTLGAGNGDGFQRSSDGVHWSAPAPAILSYKYEPSYCGMAVDANASSPYVNSVYVSCVMVGEMEGKYSNQLVVAHSSDGGATWQQVNVAPPLIGGKEDLYTTMTVGKDGTVYLSWQYCSQSSGCLANTPVYMAFSKSTDGGNAWSTPVLIATVTLHGIPNTPDAFITNTPAIGVDDSNGPYAGNLYIVVYNWTGAFMQVVVARSTDGGSTWSKPVPVAPGITHDQFLPWIAVSPAGMVGVSWLDRRNDPADVNFQAFAGISGDGGLSFEPNVQLTSEFSNPNEGIGPFSEFDGCTWNGSKYFLAAWMQLNTGRDTQINVGGIRLK
jgi:hypothetical protein